MSPQLKAAIATVLTVTGIAALIALLVYFEEYVQYLALLIPIGIVLAVIYRSFLDKFGG